MKNLLPLAFLFLLVGCFGCETDIVTGDPVGEDPTVTDPNDGGATDGGATDGGDTGNNGSGTTTFGADAREVLRLVNDLRATGCDCGNTRMPAVPALQLQTDLVTAATRHTADQVAMDRMQHAGSDGSRVGDRLSRTGYRWRAVAENVARGYRSPAAVVAAWTSSAGHCRNMMNGTYVHLGYAEEADFHTQVFAAPR